MADARIVIDADAGKVVVEAGKAKRAISSLSNEVRQQRRVGAAASAAGRRQVQTLHELGRVARRATLLMGALGGAVVAHGIKTGMVGQAVAGVEFVLRHDERRWWVTELGRGGQMLPVVHKGT
ncbi:MAG: hypothetical protein ACR2LK_14030 [Solirubrobacteraceae bacterium]